MALRDQTNSVRTHRKLYDTHVSLYVEYAPLIKKGIALHLQCSPIEFAARRAQGDRNVDLWTDGKIYPPNPLTGESPWFRNLKGFIEFCCHGESGLFGYTKALSSADVWNVERRRFMERVFQLEAERAELLDATQPLRCVIVNCFTTFRFANFKVCTSSDGMNQVDLLKNNLAFKEQALIAAKKALHHHNVDLELLFKSKHDAVVNGDTDFVEFAFGQINAVAKTITDAVETGKHLEMRVEGSKANVEIAEGEVLPQLRSILRTKKCELLDAITEVGVFPQHALQKVPERGAMEVICPYCSGAYVQNAFVPLSCGCRYHPPCMQALILSGQVNCLACGARPHGTWMAYWGFPLDRQMLTQLEDHNAKSLKAEDWVWAAPDVVGSIRVPAELESSTADLQALIPYFGHVTGNSSPSL